MRIVQVYGAKACIDAYLRNEKGEGAKTIGYSLHVHTNTADAMIDAGRKLHEAGLGKEFRVATISSNTNSFGLKQMIIIARDGEAYCTHKTAQFAPSKGDSIYFEADIVNGQVGRKYIAGHEMTYPYPAAPEEVVAEIFKP